MKKYRNRHSLLWLVYELHTRWSRTQTVFYLHHFRQQVEGDPCGLSGCSVSDAIVCQEVSPTCFFYALDCEGKKGTVAITWKRLWPALNQSPGRSAKFRQMYLKNMQYTLGLPLFKQSGGSKICNFPLESGPFWPQKYGNFPPTYRGASRGLTQLVIQGALFFSAICHILLGHVVHVTHPILLLRIWGLGDFSGQTLSDSAYCTYHFKYGVVVLPPFKKDIGIFGLTTGNYHFDHKFTRCYALPHELVVQIFYVH